MFLHSLLSVVQADPLACCAAIVRAAGELVSHINSDPAVHF